MTRILIMLGITLITAFAPAPALAWEMESNRLCTLVHAGKNADVRVTYDPVALEYAIAISPDGMWAEAEQFALLFDGPRRNAITTDRHELSDDRKTVKVTDTGFGNVLNGLEYNFIVTALLGKQAFVISLTGAAPAVREFRDCVSAIDI